MTELRRAAAVALGLWLVGALMWFLFDIWVQFGCDDCAGIGAIIPLAAWLVAYAAWLTWTVIDGARSRSGRSSADGRPRSWFRWLSVLPAAVAGGAVPYIAGLPVVNYLPAHTLGQGLVRVLAVVLVSASFVSFGSRTAPSQQLRAGMILAVVFVAVSIGLGVLANEGEETGAIVRLLVLPSLLGAGAIVLAIRLAPGAPPSSDAVSPS